MIAIVDYGLGNVRAFTNIYKKLGIDSSPATTPDDLENSDKIILPGVGAFDWAMSRLNNSGLRDVLDENILEKRKPILGVCVGMQILMETSEEGTSKGLGWIKGEVVKFDNSSYKKDNQLPHMGWNNVSPVNHDTLFKHTSLPEFYFLHSYYIKLSDSEQALATTTYGSDFTSAIKNENIYGTQFHPEKSHKWGIQLLKNFADLS